jgi:putative chitinase
MTPLHYRLAEADVGIREWPGARDNPLVVKYFADVGHSWVDDDETAWCAAFTGSMLERTKQKSTGKLNARSYLQWGDEVASLDDARKGDVIVMWRVARDAWQGHVGFYVAHDRTTVTLISGNMKNRVGMDKFARSRILRGGIRRAPKLNGPLGVPIDEPITLGNKITEAMIRQMAPRGRNDLVKALPALLNRYLSDYEVNTPQRIALFLANILAETGGLKIMEENMNYTATRLTVVWPSRFPTVESAKPYARNPRKLANKVYNRFDNRGIPDAGWNYRGRGFMQTTFIDSYRAAEKATGLDLVANPDLLLEAEPALIAALVEWKSKGCNELADQHRLTACRKAINGGAHGLTRMKNYYRVALPIVNGVRLREDALDAAKVIVVGGGGAAVIVAQYNIDWVTVALVAAVAVSVGFLIWKRRKLKKNVDNIVKGLPNLSPKFDIDLGIHDDLARAGLN